MFYWLGLIADWVVGVQKGKNLDHIIFEWSLTILSGVKIRTKVQQNVVENIE